MAHDVVVVGSINRDLTLRTPSLPHPGETVLGSGHVWGPGGKGANQAVAAARLGARVALVGMVGDDEAGRSLTAGLDEEEIDTTWLAVHDGTPTGMAVITVDERGANSIVVSAGANMALRPENVEAAAEVIAEAAVVVAQLEIPLETVMAAAELTRGRLILNPAPAHDLPGELMARVSVLVPNRSELASLRGDDEPGTVDEAVTMADRLEGPDAIVVTLGEKGAVLVEAATHSHFTPPRVKVVDTTGAGDAFCGALAHRLSSGSDLQTAVRWAVAAGALATTREGAQAALPSLEEIDRVLDSTAGAV